MGVENDRYHANTARISNSMLSVLKRSPQEFLQTFVTQTIVNEQSSSMALGELVHSLALEPDTFSSRYAVVPKCDRRTTEGKVAWAEFQVEANGKQLIDGDLYQQACECVESLSNHDIGRYYINELPRDAVIEVPIIAEGALTAELVARFGPVTDFFAVGEEIWGADNPLAALRALLAPLG